MRDSANIRRHERLALRYAGPGHVDRPVPARAKYARVRIFDLSQSGVRLELPEPVDGRAVISICSDDMKVQGQATVRFCRRQGTKYVVGAEFVGAGILEARTPSYG